MCSAGDAKQPGLGSALIFDLVLARRYRFDIA